MNNIIYQITTSPIKSDEYLSENDFCEHWFVGSIADYVNDNEYRDDEIKCLRESFVKNQVAVFNEDDSFTILPEGKENYFETAFKKCMETIKTASLMTLGEFVDKEKSFMLIFDIKNNYCNKFNDYVSSNEFDTIPLDEFIRQAVPGTQYYIGGILSYHR